MERKGKRSKAWNEGRSKARKQVSDASLGSKARAGPCVKKYIKLFILFNSSFFNLFLESLCGEKRQRSKGGAKVGLCSDPSLGRKFRSKSRVQVLFQASGPSSVPSLGSKSRVQVSYPSLGRALVFKSNQIILNIIFIQYNFL